MSISAKLSALAKKKSIPFQQIATTFLLERMVARLVSHQTLKQKLIFKGGYVSLRIYGSSRYTVDLDALLIKGDVEAVVAQARKIIEADINDGVWFYFENQQSLETSGEYGGIRLIYRAGYGEPPKDIKRAQLVHFDIGIGDPVTPNPIETNTLSLLEDFNLSWLIYPLETIVAEKLHALCQRGSLNSRSKDIYDLYLFLPRCDAQKLKAAIIATFNYRQERVPENFAATLRQIDSSLLKKGWTSATGDIVQAPSFEEAFGTITSVLEEKF